MSPLRQRMIEAMTVRGMSPRTAESYTESIARLSRHYGGCNPEYQPMPGVCAWAFGPDTDPAQPQKLA